MDWTSFLRLKKRVSTVSKWFVICLVVVHSCYYIIGRMPNSESPIHVIESEIWLTLLNPLNGGSLGFAFPYAGLGYVNLSKIERLGLDVDGVIRHEEMHLQQYRELGFWKYYKTDQWKREGLAEVARGQPTLNPCVRKADDTSVQAKYSDYFVVSMYLTQALMLDDVVIYEYESFPLDDASKWYQHEYCTTAR